MLYRKNILWVSIVGIIVALVMFLNFYNPNQLNKCFSIFSLHYWYALKSFSDYRDNDLGVPVRTNFPDIKIKPGGIFRLGNKICELSDLNNKKIFFSISKQEVINYVDYMKIGLSLGYSFDTTIYNTEQYQDKNHLCDTPVAEKDKRVTTVSEQEDHFVVNWIYYSSYGVSGYYEAQLEVSKAGNIRTIKPDDIVIYCGRGTEL